MRTTSDADANEISDDAGTHNAGAHNAGADGAGGDTRYFFAEMYD